MYLLIAFCLAILAAIIHLAISTKPCTFARNVEMLLAYILPLTIGAGNFLALGQIALPAAGLLCIWQRRGFWMATVLISTLFSFRIVLAHVQLLLAGQQPLLGPFLYLGYLTIPSIYLILTAIYCIQNNWFRQPRS